MRLDVSLSINRAFTSLTWFGIIQPLERCIGRELQSDNLGKACAYTLVVYGIGLSFLLAEGIGRLALGIITMPLLIAACWKRGQVCAGISAWFLVSGYKNMQKYFYMIWLPFQVYRNYSGNLEAAIEEASRLSPVSVAGELPKIRA